MAEDRAVAGLTVREKASQAKTPEDRHSKHVPWMGTRPYREDLGCPQSC